MGDAAQRLKVVRFWQSPGSAQTYLLPTLLVLAGMGLLVLLIACANLAGLVLVRGVSRSGEIAMRLALGAPRSRIFRLLVVENVLVALPGAVLGVLLASRGLASLVAYAETLAAPQRLYFNIEVDQLVMGFAAVVTCLCAVAFGLVPALKSARIDLMSAMKAGVTSRGAGRGGMRTGLVVAQVAVSMLLLIGAGLVTRSFEAAQRVNPGFEPAHLTSVSLDLKQNGYDAVRGREFYRKLLDAARADAGVESATLATYIPMNLLDTPSQAVVIDGYEPKRGEDLAMLTNTVAPDYFRTLRIGLRAGREFQDRDDESGTPVAVVNNTLAEKYWGGAESAIGKRLRVAGGGWRTVIGVAADVKYLRVNESPRPYVYLPYLQAYRPTMILHTRGPLSDDVLLDQARAHVVALDPDLPILSAALASDHVKGPLLFYNFAAFMLFIFGSAGMALAALGTYGLVAYTVKQSTHDIGIRMAIGASRASVVRTFLSRGLRLGAIGSLIGVVAALAVTRLMGAVLFEVSATDAASLARAFGVVLGGVVLATLIPAWRASRIDPLRALRHE